MKLRERDEPFSQSAPGRGPVGHVALSSTVCTRCWEDGVSAPGLFPALRGPNPSAACFPGLISFCLSLQRAHALYLPPNQILTGLADGWPVGVPLCFKIESSQRMCPEAIPYPPGCEHGKSRKTPATKLPPRAPGLQIPNALQSSSLVPEAPSCGSAMWGEM